MNNLLKLLADAAQATGDAAAEEIPASSQFIVMLVNLLPLILIFVVFYFLLIRPQQKKDKEAKAMLNALKVGDRVCTIGGIYGTITRIKDDVLTVEVGDAKTPMKFARWAIRGLDTTDVTNDAEQLN